MKIMTLAMIAAGVLTVAELPPAANAQSAPEPNPPGDIVPAPNAAPDKKDNPKEPANKEGMVVKPPTGVDPDIVKPMPPVDSNMPVIKPEQPDGTPGAAPAPKPK